MLRFFLIVLAIGAGSLFAVSIVQFEVPRADTLELVPEARFQSELISESSGIVRSTQFDGIFWTHNDSGDEARLFPVRLDGTVAHPAWIDNYTGLHIPDAVNIDWEDIAVDDDMLIIGACGNNANCRRDLALYLVKEPNPYAVDRCRTFQTIQFHYPEQDGFPPQMRNYDCEAVFTAGGFIYLLTKHRSDQNTFLYRVDAGSKDFDQPAVRLAGFDAGGMVTAADCSSDGTKLAVLTYTAVWVFTSAEPERWFAGAVMWQPISAKQCEAICWDDDWLVITNEQMDIFRIDPATFIQIRD